jgi:hypothetical protein
LVGVSGFPLFYFEDSEGTQEEDNEEPAERLAMIVGEDEDGQFLGLQYSSKGEDYQLEEYKQYLDQDGQTKRMYILQTVEDLKFEVVNDLSDNKEHRIPVLVEASELEESAGSDDKDLAKIWTWFGAMDTMSAEPKPKRQYTPVIKKLSRTMDHPVRKTEENRCLLAYVTVNGIEAFTLFFFFFFFLNQHFILRL